ncbi:MAG: ATP-binding cassette domain-containing protein [Psychrilyobacter sp.]|uniref:ATP-binding cassette domain-containing protein n=1 Tax=Psychrilyobacter sp. TaxID=2586924 RepID=UPI003C763B0F
MLKFKNITTNGKKPHLKNLNLNVLNGKFALLNYKSKIEKNKMIDLICQLDTPQSGGIIVGGKNLSKFNCRSKVIQKRIGICFEDFKLIQTKNVLANVILPLKIHTKLPPNKLIEVGEKQLKNFGLLDKKNDFLTTLNLEEKQKLNIARSLILDPELIILDNPQIHLKIEEIESLMKYFQDLNKNGKTIVIFTNNKKIENMINCDKYILEKGAISNV